MPRLTLADVKNSRVPSSVNIPPSDPRLVEYVNEATQRLLKAGKWWGTYGRYRLCATAGLITFPRQIATIEAVALCGRPIPVHDMWYEFLENGWGTRKDGDGICECDYRGRFPVFSDIIGTDKKVRLVCDVGTDIGKTVLVLGYDANGNWIRTTQGGVLLDGEVVVLAQTPGTLSVNLFSAVTDIQVQQPMDGQWWLYEYDTTLLTQRLIGQYQYDDNRPSFARYLFPSIRNCSSGNCTSTLVEAICKLDFIPVVRDTDYVIIGDIMALKFACMASKAAEEERYSDETSLMNKAVQELENELDHYLGSGRRIGINVVGSSIGQVDPIPTLI